MQNHKDKQKKYKDLDDKIYIQEAVEKRLPKERPKVIVKQTLVFKKDVKQKLEDPNKNNQEKALILVNDLAQKIDKKPSSITEKDIPRSNYIRTKILIFRFLSYNNIEKNINTIINY